MNHPTVIHPLANSRSARRSPLTGAFLPVLGVLASAPVAAAQSTIHDFLGNWDFGNSVSAAVDFDQDGRSDVAIGTPRKNKCHGGTGDVRVLSGLSGTQLYLWNTNIWLAYGFDLDAAGDVNADGFADLIDSAPDNFPDCPYVDFATVHSGADGTTLKGFAEGTGTFDDLATCGVGDINGDGYDDVAFGIMEYKTVRVYSGKTGATLLTNTNAFANGCDVSDVGDIDLDGRVDFAIGDRLEGGNGTVRIYSGVGPLIATVPGLTAGEWFGEAIDGVGDIDLDGHPDLLVGAPHASPNGTQSGAARLVSGISFGVVASFPGAGANVQFGHAVTRQLDFDGDTRTDLAVGSLGGYVKVFSGATLASIATLTPGGLPGTFGYSVDGSGDVDGDGFGDLVIGSPSSSSSGQAAVRVVGYCAGSTLGYGAGCPGSGGFVPKIALDGCSTPGGSVTLTIDDALGHSSAVLLFGLQQGSASFPNGCSLLVTPVLPLTLTIPLPGIGPGQGFAKLSSTIPINTPPAVFTMQAFIVDPPMPGGFSATGGLEVTIP